MKYLYGMYPNVESLVEAVKAIERKYGASIRTFAPPPVSHAGYPLLAECQCPELEPSLPKESVDLSTPPHLPTCPEYGKAVVGGNPSA